MGQQKVLIIEDDPQLIEIVGEQVADLGLEYDQAHDGRSGLELALSNDYILVILDLGLPNMGGKEVCKRLRAAKELLPIMVVTGESSEASTVLTLELGADEYITKPIRPLEFRARANALLRRSRAQDSAIDGARDSSVAEAERTLAYRDLKIDLHLQRASIGEVILDLSRSEFDLLLLFVENAGRVLSREQIVDELWGESTYSYEQNIRTTISRLRAKLEEHGRRSPYIVTQRGFGYRLAHDGE